MRYKKLLLVTFFIALFIFQQAQASAKIPSAAQVLAPAGVLQGYNPPAKIYVRLWHLKLNGSRDPDPAYTECASGDNAYGCVATGSESFYPYDTNPALVDVENDYLLDVVPREMDPRFYHSVAVSAQAIAARSFAYYWNNEGFNLWNSSDYQVFVPYTFEQWLGPNYPTNSNAPCQSNDLNVVQQIICNAVSSRYYIAPYNSDQPAKTEFSSDILGMTQSGDMPYLQSVQDPISTICDSLTGIYGNNRGMSQEGASRWARGNQCAMAESGDAPWPVTWSDYRQILVHYYTGIDILDAGGSPVAPNDRWNLLWHNNFGFAVGATPVLDNAHLYSLQLQLQNTSVSDWAENEITLSYQWTVRGADPVAENWLALGTLPALEKGDSTPDRNNSPLTVSVPAPCGTGDYTLHLDAGRNGNWFSSAGWPDARIDVTIQISTPQAALGRGYYADGLGALYYNDQDDGQWQIDGQITWQTFSPPLVFSTVEPFINFDTDTSSPAPGVNGTFWSAIWEGNLYAPQTGQYRFYLGGLDDGGRLIVDGVTHIESWLVQGPHEYFSPPLNLTQGLHSFRVEYAQGPGDEAGLSVCWEGPAFVKEVIGASGPIEGQSTPTPFMTPTPLPSATPTLPPTPTSTLEPTSEPWGWWSAAEEAALQDEPQVVREEYSNLLSRVRDEVMLPDPKGDAYIRLVYRHAPEITSLLLSDASLRQETRALMLEVRPLLENLLVGKTDGTPLSADWVKRALVLLGNVEKKSSPALKAEIRWWRTWLPRFVSKNGQEIWEMLPPRQAGNRPQIEGNPEELVLQSLSAEDARAFGGLLSQVRDEVMRPRKGGELYISLVYRYTPEVVSILLNDETLRKEAESLLLEAKPGLEFWLGQRKAVWHFSDDWVSRVEALLAKLAEKGSPELSAEANWWQERVQNWVGMTPQEIWENLLREPRVQDGQ